VKPAGRDPFREWYAALEARHLRSLTFAEVRRAVQALSSLYVERRDRIARGGDLGSAGKRAAFALFYAPLHFLLVREVVRALHGGRPAPGKILDLGCGTGAGGAAWALEAAGSPSVLGVDTSGWAVEEARHTFRSLGVDGTAQRGSAETARMPGAGAAILAAFVVNEIGADARERILPKLLDAFHRGARVLVIEPIARRPTPWWPEWSQAFAAAGGIDSKWRFPVDLPARLRLLDRAAGLDHRELTARTLWLDGVQRVA
jgi:hypothetical protein